jgi:hypothetical protein
MPVNQIPNIRSAASADPASDYCCNTLGRASTGRPGKHSPPPGRLIATDLLEGFVTAALPQDPFGIMRMALFPFVYKGHRALVIGGDGGI